MTFACAISWPLSPPAPSPAHQGLQPHQKGQSNAPPSSFFPAPHIFPAVFPIHRKSLQKKLGYARDVAVSHVYHKVGFLMPYSCSLPHVELRNPSRPASTDAAWPRDLQVAESGVPEVDERLRTCEGLKLVFPPLFSGEEPFDEGSPSFMAIK